MTPLGGPPTTEAFDASGMSVCVINRMGREDVGGKRRQDPIPEQNDHRNGAAYSNVSNENSQHEVFRAPGCIREAFAQLFVQRMKRHSLNLQRRLHQGFR